MLWMHGRVRPCVHKDFYHCSSLGIRKDLRPRYVIKMLVCRRKTNYCLSPLTAKVFSKQFIFTFFCTICTSKQQKPNQGVHFLSTQRFIASRRPNPYWCGVPYRLCEFLSAWSAHKLQTAKLVVLVSVETSMQWFSFISFTSELNQTFWLIAILHDASKTFYCPPPLNTTLMDTHDLT